MLRKNPSRAFVKLCAGWITLVVNRTEPIRTIPSTGKQCDVNARTHTHMRARALAYSYGIFLRSMRRNKTIDEVNATPWSELNTKNTNKVKYDDKVNSITMLQYKELVILYSEAHTYIFLYGSPARIKLLAPIPIQAIVVYSSTASMRTDRIDGFQQLLKNLMAAESSEKKIATNKAIILQ